MSEVEKIMNKRAINEKIVKNGKTKPVKDSNFWRHFMHKMFVMSLDVKISEQKLLLVIHQANRENKFYMI